MSDKTGGPAFPLTVSNPNEREVHACNEVVGSGETVQFTGMNMRDYFAAKATEEDIVYQIRAMAPRNGFGEVMDHKVSRAAARFAHADEMIEERAK